MTFDEADRSGKLAISITDVMGKRVQNTSLHGGNRQLDLSNLATGVYFIHISDERNARAATRMIVKE